MVPIKNLTLEEKCGTCGGDTEYHFEERVGIIEGLLLEKENARLRGALNRALRKLTLIRITA